MTPLGAFCFYASLNAIALVMIFIWLPETKGLTLEELDQVFSVPTKDFTKYQCKVWLPWFIKRYICHDKSAHLKPIIERGHTNKGQDEDV